MNSIIESRETLKEYTSLEIQAVEANIRVLEAEYLEAMFNLRYSYVLWLKGFLMRRKEYLKELQLKLNEL